MTRKFQSGQEKRAKNRNCVYLLSAPPNLKYSHVVTDLGKPAVVWKEGGLFSSSCRVEEEIILTISESHFLSSAIQKNHFCTPLSENVFDTLV